MVNIPSKKIEEALKNLTWFQRSGVMDPSDGGWGVGERIVLTNGNSALEKMYSTFPIYTRMTDIVYRNIAASIVIFEVAMSFMLAGQIFDTEEYKSIARNILRYLFRRSATRSHVNLAAISGIWKWSTLLKKV